MRDVLTRLQCMIICLQDDTKGTEAGAFKNSIRLQDPVWKSFSEEWLSCVAAGGVYCVSLGKGLSGDAWSTLMDNWFALYETRVHIGTSRWIIRNTERRECRGKGGKGNYEERKKVVWEKVRKTDKWPLCSILRRASASSPFTCSSGLTCIYSTLLFISSSHENSCLGPDVAEGQEAERGRDGASAIE